MRQLIVLAPNWLGDAVMALPAIDDVRRLTGARVIVAARRSVAPLFTLVPGVDDIVELQWRGRAGDPRGMVGDIRRLRSLRGDVALLLPNSFASAWLAFAAGTPQRWGYATDGRTLLLTRAVEKPRHAGEAATGDDGISRHQGTYYQHLVRELGASNGPLEPRVVVPERARAEARALLATCGWQTAQPLVVFAPGAAYGTAKRWWPTHFAQLAADLVQQHGAHVTLVGSAADAEATRAVSAAVPDRARASVSDLAGRTSLERLAAVLSLARACVSNDSGAMHLAAAVGVPLTAVFGPTNEHETSPLAHAPVDLLIHQVPCRPCMLRECPIDHPCMRDLAPAVVLSSVKRMLEIHEVVR